MKSAQQLHRSITFWSGLLVLGFGVWAWWDSFRYESSCVTGKFNWGNSWGGVWVMHEPSLVPGLMGSRVRYHFREKLESPLLQGPFFLRGQGGTYEQSRALPPATSAWNEVRRYLSYQGRDVWIVFIPYAIILPGIGGAWVVLLVWRGKRRKRSLRVFSVQFSGKA